MEASEVFTDVQHKIYQLLMQSYTINFGYKVSEPLIVTTAIITDQSLAVGRRRNRRRRTQQHQSRGRRLQLLENATESTNATSNLVPSSSQLLLRQFDPLPTNLLVISFTMKYTTKFGFDNIEEYPAEFQNYINSNLENVTIDMSMRFLPVLEAKPVIMYMPVSTGVPSPNPSSLSPMYIWNGNPTTSAPSKLLVPTMAPYPSPPIIEEKANFVVGLAVGLVVAAIVVGVFIGYIIIKNRRKEERLRLLQQQGDNEVMMRGGQELERNPSLRMEEGIEVSAEDVLFSHAGSGEEEAIVNGSSGGNKSASDQFIALSEQQQQYHHHHQQQQQQQQQHQSELQPSQYFDGNSILETGSSNNNDASSTRPNIPSDAIADSIFSNHSMVSGGGSFSSNPDDFPDHGVGGVGSQDVRLNTLQDEFDNYKNQDLESMRNGVEETVYGAESMMSLAMTRALMGEEDTDIHPSWGEAEGDPESIEANGLCETNDWLRKNEHSTLDERYVFIHYKLDAPHYIYHFVRVKVTPSTLSFPSLEINSFKNC